MPTGQTLETSTLVVVAVIPLIAWRLYSRVKRLMSRQKSRLWRHWIAAIFFPFVVLMLGTVAMHDPLSVGSLAIGVAAGVGLAVWGLRLTRFEATGQGFFYTPNARIGLALSALILVRLAYRLLVGGMASFRDPATAQAFTRSPATQVVVGLVMGYYATYAMGLIRWRRVAKRPVAEPAAPA